MTGKRLSDGSGHGDGDGSGHGSGLLALRCRLHEASVSDTEGFVTCLFGAQYDVVWT